ncbi:MAG: AIR synthase-related protein, partial [Thermosynechococcaceae cyanobacterium]
LLDGSRIQVGDVAIGLASSGVHSNGFSLVRKIVADRGLTWGDRPVEFAGQSLDEVFLTPTQIYVKSVLAARQGGLDIRGMAHITGGGLPENLPRCLQPDQSVALDCSRWSIPTVFQWLAETGDVALPEMFKTFNMGIGMVLIVPPDQAERAIAWFPQQGINAYAIGEVITGQQTLSGLP